jgi:ABC-type sugar transport system ATPase subunit
MRVLLLDEPYSGPGRHARALLGRCQSTRREGIGILIVSHLLAERERPNRVYELRDGRPMEG